jgi:hypothetical protein
MQRHRHRSADPDRKAHQVGSTHQRPLARRCGKPLARWCLINPLELKKETPMSEVNDFTTDTHRRVAAQCMRPRSASEIAYALKTLDPHVDEDAYHRDGVNEYLADLEADGLVVNLGSFDDAKAALKAQDAHKDAIDFQGDRDAFSARAAHPTRFPFLEQGEDHWVFTKLCHAKLTGEVA